MNFKFLAFFSSFSICILPLLVLFEKNPGEIWSSDFFILTILTLLSFSAVLGIAYFFKRNFIHVATACMLIFLPLVFVNESTLYMLNLAIWCFDVASGVFFLFLKIQDKFLEKFHSFLAIPVSLLLIFYTSSIIKSKIDLSKKIQELTLDLDQRFVKLKQEQTKTSIFNGNIYFIILDEFISPKMFRDYYAYDNESFFSFLENSDFKIIKQSYSNYPWTIPSVSSMVSMDYHKNWVSKKEFPQLAHFLIRYNLSARFLASEGYDTYFLPSIYWLGNPSKGLLNDFLFRSKSYGLTLSLIRSTPFTKIAREFQRKYHREHILEQLNQLREINKKNSTKKFVFAHFLCPHRPIVFNKNGDKLSPQDAILAEKDKKHSFYLNQAKFISDSVQEVVSEILRSSESPPIIVLLSDHGKFPIGTSGKGKRTLPLSQLSWRLSNFIAIYLPDSLLELPELMTPVNVMRNILRSYFGYKLPSKPDFCCIDFFDYELKEYTSSLSSYQKEYKISTTR